MYCSTWPFELARKSDLTYRYRGSQYSGWPTGGDVGEIENRAQTVFE